jgi:hypothetical protein
MDSKKGGRGGFIAIHIEGGTGPNDVIGNKIRIISPDARGAIVVDGGSQGPTRVNRNDIEYLGSSAPEHPIPLDEISKNKTVKWVDTYLCDVFSGLTVAGFIAFCSFLAKLST